MTGPAVASDERWQFHLLSFEGPDPYARAGGIASRVSGLAGALADGGFDTHLWFIGDPGLPGHETQGRLTLHRWCQWISAYHPGGVYDGEEGKQADYAASLPPFLIHDVLRPGLAHPGRRAVILAEEWQTVNAVLHLDWLLRRLGLRDRVDIFWNANNTFGFDRIDWPRLRAAARPTTVSRYMRYQMWKRGVDPLVIPNGLVAEAYCAPDAAAVRAFRHHVPGRFVLGKIARWDPDKRWLLAVDTIGDLKRRGADPILVARGGVEAHGGEVVRRAAVAQLRVAWRQPTAPGEGGLLAALSALRDVDVVLLATPLDGPAARLLLRGADAVLANSGREPFGLVGLETMAVGGLACTGGTGEDYVVAGWNALVLQTTDPAEFVAHYQWLRADARRARFLRRNGLTTARRYAWAEIIQRNLLPHLAHPDPAGDTLLAVVRRAPRWPRRPETASGAGLDPS